MKLVLLDGLVVSCRRAACVDYQCIKSNNHMLTCYVMLHGMIMSSLAYEFVYACMIVKTRGLCLISVKP